MAEEADKAERTERAERARRAERAGRERGALPDRLRDAAHSHRPDRDRMLARVERAMTLEPVTREPVPREPAVLEAAAREKAAERPPGRARPGGGHSGERGGERGRQAAPWTRVLAVAAAVASAVGLGGLAVGAATDDTDPGRSVLTSSGPAVPPPPSPTPVGSRTPAAHSPTARPPASAQHHRPRGRRAASTAPPDGAPRSASTAPATATPSARSTRTTAPAGGTDGATASGGSPTGRGVVDASSSASWTQSDVVLTTSGPLTSLTVELRVARTAGAAATGTWSSAPGVAAPSVAEAGAELVYRWTLQPGTTLAPGTYTFAGQFRHATGGRDTGADRWTARADGPGGPATVGGGF